MESPLEVLTALVRIPSPSGKEEAAVEYVRGLLEAAGHRATVAGRNVCAERGSGGPLLLLNSHLDTVPATAAWTRDPFGGTVEEGRFYGLGAGDAKSAVAGLLFAFLHAPLPRRGRLLFAATCDEETGGEGMEKLVGSLPRPDAALVGEPTAMQVCSAQKGLVKLEVVARGRAGHASRPWEGVNAIERAAEDVLAVQGLEFPEEDPLLGRATLAVTMIAGGVRSNVIPPECRVTVDGRSTPDWPNERLVDAVRHAASGEVVVKSARFQPVHTAAGAAIVRAALNALDLVSPRAFGGVSDLFHLRRCPGIIVGPGAPEQSHQADEHIAIADFLRGVEGYRRIVEAYFEEEA
ncbi:MAG: M20/M25/M40 family metallo-hydrolase [Candidatus Wallbacteria bacterium]|nr:M20/M25/M40 family metallo-hydrolase [Candidatus Wallbacteria bacterium]